jgi:hypothetical protein
MMFACPLARLAHHLGSFASSPLVGEDNVGVALSGADVRWGVRFTPAFASTPHPGPPPQGGREGKNRESGGCGAESWGILWN